MSDRTGELCPFCKKGKLHPTGKRDFVEPAKTPKSGEARSESTEYECDKCHKRTKAIGISLVETLTATNAAVKVYKKNVEKNDS